MHVSSTTIVAVITGSVWTGSRSAPRKLLVKDGFVRPTWFTTGRKITDADYKPISSTQYHKVLAEYGVLVHMQYGGDDIGILKQDFVDAADQSERGVLIVGPPEIAAQVADQIPHAVIFTLKDQNMNISHHLEKAKEKGQMVRIDVNALQMGAWNEVHRVMAEKLGLPYTNVVI